MELINLFGLCLNMIGVVLLFFWSLPQASASAGTERAVEDGTPMEDGRTAGEHRAEALRNRRNAKRIAWAALALILAGFVCQFIAAAWPYLHAWIAASICRQ
ncbi:hypothetical protein [Pseudomonas qingdaonensis]|uniref:hypothetical protein n=1 Tax=Pseudomonas qingdaonensis TaxID=2056231 RepID=UPI002E184A19|nr:hypothetical protein [Pseudomonas qingdaonensis]